MTLVLQKLKSRISSGSKVLILQSVKTPSSSKLKKIGRKNIYFYTEDYKIETSNVCKT